MVNENEENPPKPITFVAKIAKQGKKARIITIPKNFWMHGIVDENKIYRVELTEIGNREEQS